MDTHLLLAKVAGQILSIESFLAVVNEGKDRDVWDKGGYFTMYLDGSNLTYPPLICTQLGVVGSDSARRALHAISMEKAHRLLLHPSHMSSYQTRKPEAKQYGGAVRVGKFILSFSGLTEVADEALMIIISYRLNLLSLIHGGAILAESGVDEGYFKRLLEASHTRVVG